MNKKFNIERNNSFNNWRLKDNPFITLPPNDAERKQVFTGREAEIETIINLVNRPRGIFLSGMFGIGKSILLLETLSRLEEKGCLTIYTKYDKNIGFLRLALMQVKRRIKSPDEHHEERSIIQAIEDLIKRPDIGLTPVIVLDDSDKNTDSSDIQSIIYDARQLIDVGFAVIIPGHPLGPTVTFGSCADILFPLPLSSLSEDELVEMMEKYLNLSRNEDSMIDIITYPFTAKAARLIAKSVAEANLTPRIFNHACQLLLESAAIKGVKLIDETFISNSWSQIAKDFLLQNIKEEDYKYLAILNTNVEVSEDNREVIRKMGGPFAEYSEIEGSLVKLVEQNIAIQKDKDRKQIFAISPHLLDDFFIIR